MGNSCTRGKQTVLASGSMEIRPRTPFEYDLHTAIWVLLPFLFQGSLQYILPVPGEHSPVRERDKDSNFELCTFVHLHRGAPQQLQLLIARWNITLPWCVLDFICVVGMSTHSYDTIKCIHQQKIVRLSWPLVSREGTVALIEEWNSVSATCCPWWSKLRCC